MKKRCIVVAALALSSAFAESGAQARPRARDIGLVVGIFPTGEHNAITDVAGVRVGHATLIEGDTISTGVTSILPHAGDLYRSRVPAAVHVLNGYGKMLGIAQVQELGELETPLLLTCTLCVWRAADAMAAYLLAKPGMERVRSLNVVVGETNDGGLSDIRLRPIRPEHVRAALESARPGPVEEGRVGAGAGTVTFGWKGGIGTSSRRIPERLDSGAYTVGVLVQSNFGGILTMNGAPVGRELGKYSFADQLGRGDGDADGRGSIMIVIATDAPLGSFALKKLAERATMGLARTGSFSSYGSGDFIIAFSTAESVRRPGPGAPAAPSPAIALNELPLHQMSPLFEAVVEATEEAIYNSMLKATTTTYRGATIEALPIDRVLDVLRRYNTVRP